VNKEEVLKAVKTAREKSKQRNFTQSVDLCINFKGIDFKKQENKIDVDVKLPHSKR
jgi:large subunit ribosomal protein L1